MKTTQILFRYALCAWLVYAVYWAITASDRTIFERVFFPVFVIVILVLNELQLVRLKKLDREAQTHAVPTLENNIYHDYRDDR